MCERLMKQEQTASEDTDWSYAGGHQSPEDWWTPQGGKSESLVDMIHQQLLTMPIGEKEKENCGKVGGSVGQQRISGDSGEKTGRVHTMFGAGTSECAGDTEIIGAGRNRGRRFEGMSDSAVESGRKTPGLRLHLVKNYLEDSAENIEISAIAKGTGRGRGGGKETHLPESGP